MRKWSRCLGVVVISMFAFTFIVPTGAIAQMQQNQDMEKKCAATKAGTEANEATRKECAAYFEQTDAAGAAGAAAGASATGGMSAGTVALIAVGVAAAGAAVAAAAGGGGGGSSSAVSHNKASTK